LSLTQNTKIILVFVLFYFIVTPVALASEPNFSANELKAIHAIVPGATVVNPSEIDPSCGPIQKSSSFIRADLNDDHRQDFAALLNIGETGKVTKWQGSSYKEIEYAFVIFLGDDEDKYKSVLTERFTDLSPLSAILVLQEPGRLFNFDTGKEVNINKTGIAFVNCEKSTRVYYFQNGKITTITAMD